MHSSEERKGVSPYRLTEEQEKVYAWLKGQRLNIDDDTMNYWVRKYHPKRLVDVVRFAHARCAEGQQIRNIGGWIHKLLRDGAAVVNDECHDNREFAKQYAKVNQWSTLYIYEKYIRDEITGDDLPLTMPPDEFCRALEAVFRRKQL